MNFLDVIDHDAPYTVVVGDERFENIATLAEAKKTALDLGGFVENCHGRFVAPVPHPMGDAGVEKLLQALD